MRPIWWPVFGSSNPPELRVPEGSEVTFVATSKDVIHGFLLRAANINAMLLPRQVTRVTARFDRAGTYRPRMSERVMSGKLTILPSEVEPLTQVCGTPFHAL